MLKKLLLAFLLFLSLFNIFLNYSLANDKNDSFKSTDATSFLENNFDESNRAGELGVTIQGSHGARTLIWKFGTKIVAPIVFLIGLLLAFLGFYELAFSDKEDARKKGLNFVIYGLIGVILAVAGPFVAITLVGEEGTSGILSAFNVQQGGGNIAEKLYDQIIIKFFSLFIYLAILIVFIVLLVNAIKLMTTSSDKEDTAKHAKTIIAWNSIGLIIMLAAKNIVETFYRKSGYGMATGGQILENTHPYWLYTILNYLLAFIAFTITALIIYQAFLLLTKPDDDATYKNLKKYFVYAIVGVALIGGVYLIANFFIIR